jgi:hypothetical protein
LRRLPDFSMIEILRHSHHHHDSLSLLHLADHHHSLSLLLADYHDLASASWKATVHRTFSMLYWRQTTEEQIERTKLISDYLISCDDVRVGFGPPSGGVSDGIFVTFDQSASQGGKVQCMLNQFPLSTRFETSPSTVYILF